MFLNNPPDDNLTHEDSNLNSVKCEKNLTIKTSEYNKRLSENPNDVKLWIDFVNFQV